jgi:hypothetical protein
MRKKRIGNAGNRDKGQTSKPEGVISRGTGRRLQVRAAKGAKRAAPKHVGFTTGRRARFLSHFAATCNATAAAERAGISLRTVYNWRRDNAEFREAWHAALDQGYGRLEAGLVRLVAEAMAAIADEGAAAGQVIDPKTALAVLEAYRKHMAGARTGDIVPRRSDIEQVRARIEQSVRTLGMFGEENEDEDPSTGQPGEDPSTASRSPSPGKPGEEGDPSRGKPGEE